MSNFAVDAVPPTTVETDALVAAARAVSGSHDLEAVSRPFLDLLHRCAAFDTFYLTSVDPLRHEQQVLFVDDRSGHPTVLEGAQIDWEQTVCRQALESGVCATTDAAAEWPEQTLSVRLGIRSYVGVPVRDGEDRLLGTLCGASRRTVPADAELIEVMAMLAGLLADRWQQTRDDEARRAEQAASRLRDSALVLTEAEEELGAPLLAIQGLADQLMTSWSSMPDERRVAALHGLRTAAQDAHRRMQQLLGEAREDAMSRELELQPVEVGQVIHDVVGAVRQERPHRTVRHPVGEAARVRADRVGIQRAIRHLVEYAVEHSGDEAVLDVSLRRNGDTVVVSVEGQGIRLPAAGEEFVPFARREAATVTPIHRAAVRDVDPVAEPAAVAPAGPGLGLYVARNLVLAMGGDVRVSRSGAAAAFAVSLPAA
ncbi:signal transduction histidine kinase [Friedmanniella endophytica]|uniref:histidine kinase n=1 Tax=Microlunatus kandeliicorticis TaxID=1759536 RepID=A0A7W3IR65_9ACTN|nr:ATP-binding protein [Microlunatus kandeliicorticis]MBA8793731.1 signal transduction histidine kinase [Microlunatus kandeliicorticis]